MPDTKESPGATHVDIDEFERSQAAPAAPPKASEFKLEGDDIPEEFRGKTASEIAKLAGSFQSALRISEDARGAMRASMESRQPAPASSAPLSRRRRFRLARRSRHCMMKTRLLRSRRCRKSQSELLKRI
jgi:hypothetical protein